MSCSPEDKKRQKLISDLLGGKENADKVIAQTNKADMEPNERRDELINNIIANRVEIGGNQRDSKESKDVREKRREVDLLDVIEKDNLTLDELDPINQLSDPDQIRNTLIRLDSRIEYLTEAIVSQDQQINRLQVARDLFTALKGKIGSGQNEAGDFNRQVFVGGQNLVALLSDHPQGKQYLTKDNKKGKKLEELLDEIYESNPVFADKLPPNMSAIAAVVHATLPYLKDVDQIDSLKQGADRMEADIANLQTTRQLLELKLQQTPSTDPINTTSVIDDKINSQIDSISDEWMAQQQEKRSEVDETAKESTIGGQDGLTVEEMGDGNNVTQSNKEQEEYTEATKEINQSLIQKVIQSKEELDKYKEYNDGKNPIAENKDRLQIKKNRENLLPSEINFFIEKTSPRYLKTKGEVSRDVWEQTRAYKNLSHNVSEWYLGQLNSLIQKSPKTTKAVQKYLLGQLGLVKTKYDRPEDIANAFKGDFIGTTFLPMAQLVSDLNNNDRWFSKYQNATNGIGNWAKNAQFGYLATRPILEMGTELFGEGSSFVESVNQLMTVDNEYDNATRGIRESKEYVRVQEAKGQAPGIEVESLVLTNYKAIKNVESNSGWAIQAVPEYTRLSTEYKQKAEELKVLISKETEDPEIEVEQRIKIEELGQKRLKDLEKEYQEKQQDWVDRMVISTKSVLSFLSQIGLTNKGEVSEELKLMPEEIENLAKVRDQMTVAMESKKTGKQSLVNIEKAKNSSSAHLEVLKKVQDFGNMVFEKVMQKGSTDFWQHLESYEKDFQTLYRQEYQQYLKFSNQNQEIPFDPIYGYSYIPKIRADIDPNVKTTTVDGGDLYLAPDSPDQIIGMAVSEQNYTANPSRLKKATGAVTHTETIQESMYNLYDVLRFTYKAGVVHVPLHNLLISSTNAIKRNFDVAELLKTNAYSTLKILEHRVEQEQNSRLGIGDQILSKGVNALQTGIFRSRPFNFLFAQLYSFFQVPYLASDPRYGVGFTKIPFQGITKMVNLFKKDFVAEVNDLQKKRQKAKTPEARAELDNQIRIAKIVQQSADRRKILPENLARKNKLAALRYRKSDSQLNKLGNRRRQFGALRRVYRGAVGALDRNMGTMATWSNDKVLNAMAYSAYKTISQMPASKDMNNTGITALTELYLTGTLGDLRQGFGSNLKGLSSLARLQSFIKTLVDSLGSTRFGTVFSLIRGAKGIMIPSTATSIGVKSRGRGKSRFKLRKGATVSRGYSRKVLTNSVAGIAGVIAVAKILEILSGIFMGKREFSLQDLKEDPLNTAMKVLNPKWTDLMPPQILGAPGVAYNLFTNPVGGLGGYKDIIDDVAAIFTDNTTDIEENVSRITSTVLRATGLEVYGRLINSVAVGIDGGEQTYQVDLKDLLFSDSYGRINTQSDGTLDPLSLLSNVMSLSQYALFGVRQKEGKDVPPTYNLLDTAMGNLKALQGVNRQGLSITVKSPYKTESDQVKASDLFKSIEKNTKIANVFTEKDLFKTPSNVSKRSRSRRKLSSIDKLFKTPKSKSSKSFKFKKGAKVPKLGKFPKKVQRPKIKKIKLNTTF